MSGQGMMHCSVVESTSPVLSLVRGELVKILHSIASMKKVVRNDEVEKIVDQALQRSRLGEALRELFTGMCLVSTSSERREVLTLMTDESDYEEFDVIREIVRQILFEQIELLPLKDEPVSSSESSESSIHSVTTVRTQHMLRNVFTLRMTTDEDSEASNSQAHSPHDGLRLDPLQLDKQDFISQIVQTHLKREVFSKIDASTSMGKYVKVRSETEIAEIYTQTEGKFQLAEKPPSQSDETKAINIEKMLKRNFKRKPDPKHIEKLAPNMKPLQLELLHKDYFAVLLDEVTMLLRYAHYLSRKAYSDVLSHREKDEARRKIVQLEVVRNMLVARKMRFFAHILSALEYNIQKMKTITESDFDSGPKRAAAAKKSDVKLKNPDTTKDKAKVAKKPVTQKPKTKAEPVKSKSKPTTNPKPAEKSTAKYGKQSTTSSQKVQQRTSHLPTAKAEHTTKDAALSPIVIERIIETTSDQRTESYDEESLMTKPSVIIMPLPLRTFSLKSETVRPEINTSELSGSMTSINKPASCQGLSEAAKSEVGQPHSETSRTQVSKQPSFNSLWSSKVSNATKTSQPQCHRSILRKTVPLEWTRNQKLDTISVRFQESSGSKSSVKQLSSRSVASPYQNPYQNVPQPTNVIPRSEALNRLLAGALSSKSAALTPALVNLERITTRPPVPRTLPTKYEHAISTEMHSKITASTTLKTPKTKQVYKDEKFIPEEELLSLHYRKPTRKYLKKYEGLSKKSTFGYEYQHSTFSNKDTILPSLLADSKVFRKFSTQAKQQQQQPRAKSPENTNTKNYIIPNPMSDIPEHSVPSKWYKYTRIINRLPPPPADPNRWQLLKWNCSNNLKYVPSMDDVFSKPKSSEKHTSNRSHNKHDTLK